MSKQLRADAGARHEQDVAFYLRRAFGNSPDLQVFNNIKFSYEDENVQIDHLVLHRYGFIVIESKSIKGEVKVNGHGEWARSFKSEWFGIPSPVEQAKNQIKLFKRLLQDNADNLLGTILGVRKGFGGRQYDVLIAVSSSAIIHRDGMPKDLDLVTVKAEFIPAQVEKIVASHKNKVWSLDVSPWFNDEETKSLASLLRGLEAAVETDSQTSTDVADAKASEPTTEKPRQKVESSWSMSCKYCDNQTGLAGRYGKYGYFVTCPQCEKNTPMKQPCPRCQSKETRVSKQKQSYTLTCAECGDIGTFESPA